MAINPPALFGFNDPVWRIVPDYEKNFLVAELRNAEERKAYFALIDILEPALIWSGFELPEKWWIGIECAINGLIFFHGYQNAQFALHKGIYCFRTLDKQLLWQQKNLRYVSHTGEKVRVTDLNNPDKIFEVDIHTGAETKSSAAPGNTFILEKSSSLFFIEGTNDFASVKAYIDEKLNLQVVSTVEYQEYQDKIIISFYHKFDGKYVNEILVIDNNGHILLKEEMDKNLEGFGKGTFIIIGRKLIFIKFKNQLCIYDI